MNYQKLPKVQIADNLNISTEPFTMQELNAVTSTLKDQKSPGLDNIPMLIWKDPIFHDLLLHICNDTFLHLNPPTVWRKAGITPLPKKGDLALPSNYRGISLSAIASKIYNKLLLRRIVPEVDLLLRKNKNGFRKGRSTISQILFLRRIIEEMRKLNKELTLCFVDFCKAFDSISRQAIFDILPLYGIPEAIVDAIKALYINTEATVITPDGETEFFKITPAVLQGDTLAPFIFVIVLDYILCLSLDNLNVRGLQIQPRRSRRHLAQHLTDLDFADDLALIAELVEDAEALLQSLEEAAALIGLYCNESKTEYINSADSSQDLKSLSGANIKKAQDFKYLGSWIMDSEKDFKAQTSLAWAACKKLQKLWHSNLPNDYKVFLFQYLVEPVLLYGAETWTLTLSAQRRLYGTYTNLLRRVQNIHCYFRCSNVSTSSVFWTLPESRE